MARVRIVLPTVLLILVFGVLYTGMSRRSLTYNYHPVPESGDLPPSYRTEDAALAAEHKPESQIHHATPDTSDPWDVAHFLDERPSDTSAPVLQASTPIPVDTASSPPTSPSTSISSPSSSSTVSSASAQSTRKPRRAITSSVFTSNYAGMALMLGWSLLQHNNLTALDAELVLLTLHDDTGKNGITGANRTRLEKAGWTIREAEELEFKGVNQTAIRAHHRHNLNKLRMWSWTEYDKVLFIDADCVCNGDISELLGMPGVFAAAPDVWKDILPDTRFNSGVMVFRPNETVFKDMIEKVSDERYHKPNEADQAFLQVYFKWRFFGLPMKYNFNLVLEEYYYSLWRELWPEAVILHLTMRKPHWDPSKHCKVKDKCHEGEALEWYAKYYDEMRHDLGLQDEIPILG